MMRRQKRAGPVHAGLHFVQHEKRAVSPAERLRRSKIARVRNADAAFGLDRLHDERGELAGRQLLLERVQVAEGNALRPGSTGRNRRARTDRPSATARRRSVRGMRLQRRAARRGRCRRGKT